MLTDREKRVMSSCEALFDETLELTESLVRAYSVLGKEQSAIEVIDAWYKQENFRVTHVPMMATVLSDDGSCMGDGSRYNVIGTLNEGHPGPHLVFNGHLDVVPAEPDTLWTRPPWEPWRDGGWLYGRGAGDMKSGIAAMCMAVKAVQRAGIDIQHPLTLQTVIEEECSGHGALSCVKAGHAGDFVLIPEPFGASIVSGQVGVLWFRISLDGVPTHVLDTSAGSNAIEAMTSLFSCLKALEAELNALPRHPLYADIDKPFNMNIGRISGGDWASSVPAHATLEGRIGFPPGMAVADVMERVKHCVASGAKGLGGGISNLMVDFHGFRSEGVEVALEGVGVQLLGKCHHDLTGETAKMKPLTCTTDLRAFQVNAGVSGTCYGPVAENIHGIDERVNIASIRHVLKTYALFLCRWGESAT